MFKVGDKVTFKPQGHSVGKIKKIDPNDTEFYYLVRFSNKTLMWIGKDDENLKAAPRE